MTRDDDGDVIPPHHSPVRHMVARAREQPYAAFTDMVAARAHPDAAVVMEGDTGGQIYLTCPLRHVRCSQAALEQLLRDLNALAWSEGDGLYFELLPIGSFVAGGMGGGLVIDGVWLHERFVGMGLVNTVNEVIRGDTERIVKPPAAPDDVSQRAMAAPTPCPHCGKPLRTSRARQCRHCKRQWHHESP